MLIQGTVGTRATTSSLSQNSNTDIRLGNMGDQIMSELHGKYYEACYKRSVMNAFTAAVSLPTSLNTTYTGFVLANPIGSTVNLVVLTATWGLNVAATAAATLMLAVGYNSATALSGTTVVDTTKSAFVGAGAVGTGLAYKAATLPTAGTNALVLGSIGTLAVTGYTALPAVTHDIAGQIILPPGAYCFFNASAAQTSTQFYFGMQWEEVPV